MERNENRTRIFQGRPAVTSLDEARRKTAPLRLSAAQQERWLAVLAELMNGDPDDGFTADDLARLPAFKRVESEQAVWDSGETAGQRVLRTLHDMAGAGLLHQGPQLSAFLRHKVSSPSYLVLQRVCELERTMLEALREQAPDLETGEWAQLSLRRLNQHLLDQAMESNPELLRRLLGSLARDGRGLAGDRGSLELRQGGLDHYSIKLHRDWRTLSATAERRQAVAQAVLEVLLSKVPADAPANAELLVSFGTDELTRALAADMALAGSVRDPLAAVDRGLMFLHEQGALVLQRGLAVFRQAMTLRVLPEARGKRYTKAQHQPLAQHYGERIFQIHVMAEYARLGAEKIRQALTLVTAYFTLDKRSFVARFFPDRREILERATTTESFRGIVESLGNPEQTEIVATPQEGNRLLLAGPGSGKTRVVVHRCAYLLRVRRVDPRGILVLCFNRNAALELRRRLRALGDAGSTCPWTRAGARCRGPGTPGRRPGRAYPAAAGARGRGLVRLRPTRPDPRRAGADPRPVRVRAHPGGLARRPAAPAPRQGDRRLPRSAAFNGARAIHGRVARVAVAGARRPLEKTSRATDARLGGRGRSGRGPGLPHPGVLLRDPGLAAPLPRRRRPELSGWLSFADLGGAPGRDRLARGVTRTPRHELA